MGSKNLPAILAVLALAAPALLRGDAPDSIPYQGRLSDAAGVPATGSYGIDASLYDAPSGGALLHAESHPGVSVVNGLFSLALTPSAGAFGSGAPRYLEIRVNGTTLAPRQAIASAPYALAVATGSVGAAEIVDGSVAGGALANNAVTASKVAPGTLTDADVAAGAAIALSKLAADPSVAGTINLSTNPVDWTRLKSVPAGLADGTDDVGLGAMLNGSGVLAASALNFAAPPFTVAAAAARADVGLNPSSVTLQGNAFNGAGQLLMLNASTRAAAGLGGTGADWSSSAAGGVPYFSAAGVLGVLPVGAVDQVLKLSGGMPAWAADAAGGSGTVNGSGTAGRLPLWTSTGTLGDSLLFQNGLNLGVGTVSPGVKLQVDGGTNVTAGGGGYLSLSWGPSSARLSMDGTRLQAFYTSSPGVMLLNSSGGNTGIGTAFPAYTLDVNGSVNAALFCFNGSFCQSVWPSTGAVVPAAGPVGSTLRYNGSSWVSNTNFYDDGNHVGIGTSSPAVRLHVDGGPAVTDGGGFLNGGHAVIRATRLYGNQMDTTYDSWPLALQPNGGNVGVNNPSPQEALDVNGSFNGESVCLAGDCRDSWPVSPANRSLIIAANPAATLLPAGGNNVPLPFTSESADVMGEFTPGAAQDQFVPLYGGEYMICFGLKTQQSSQVGIYLISSSSSYDLLTWSIANVEIGSCISRHYDGGERVGVYVTNLTGADVNLTGNPAENWVTIHRMR